MNEEERTPQTPEEQSAPGAETDRKTQDSDGAPAENVCAEEEQAPAEEAEKGSEKDDSSSEQESYLFFRNLVLALSALVLIFTFFGRLITVDGSSMEPTLLHGELMLVRSVGYTPQQGDIVVLTQVSFREDAIVKRVIATGGQTVSIDYLAGTVRVDGVLLDEPYIKEEMLPRGDVTDLTVPEGCIFVMGDNRNVSADSRYNYVGVIDERRVIGQAVAVIFPFDHFTAL